MNSILGINNSFYNYSTSVCNTKEENNTDENTVEKKRKTQTMSIRKGNYIYEYEVYEDGSMKLVSKIPVKKEEGSNGITLLRNKNQKRQLEIVNQYKENMRCASYGLNDKQDSLKDLIEMIC